MDTNVTHSAYSCHSRLQTKTTQNTNYKKIIPTAHDLEEAIDYLKKLYGTVEEVFTAYYFELKE